VGTYPSSVSPSLSSRSHQGQPSPHVPSPAARVSFAPCFPGVDGPNPQTPTPQPQNPTPKPQTTNKTQNPEPKPLTLNPKPQTPKPPNLTLASQASTDRRESEKPAARTRRDQQGPGFRKQRPDMDLDATACSQRGCGERHDFLPFTCLPSRAPCRTEQIKPALEVTQGEILSQSPTDAISSRWHLYGS